MVVFNAHSNKVPLIVLYILGNALLKASAYSGVLGNALIRKFLCDSPIVDQEIVVRFMLLQRKQKRSSDGGNSLSWITYISPLQKQILHA